MDSKGDNTIIWVTMVHSWFTYVHKGVLVSMQSYIGVSEYHLWIRLIN